jgi:integrase
MALASRREARRLLEAIRLATSSRNGLTSLLKIRTGHRAGPRLEVAFGEATAHSCSTSLHALLRRSLGVAVRWQLIPWNPVTAVDPPSLTSVEVHPFDTNEARLFLAAASGDRFQARWLIAVSLGLRQGEVLGLAWSDVDLDQRVLAVRQTLQYRPGEGFHLLPPKTARSRRIVPLPDAVIDALKLRREQQETDRLPAGIEFWEDWGLVLTTRFGTPLSPRNDYRDFQRLVGAAGLRHVRLHDLRHTAASLMLAQGVSLCRDGDSWAFTDQHHDEHLQPCNAGLISGSGGTGGGLAVRGAF